MKNISYILIFALVLLSCNKEELPENYVGDAVFYLTGEIDGETKTFVAGDDGFYMHTKIDREFGIQILEGNLSNDQESLKIQFFETPLGKFDPTIEEFNWLNYNHIIKQVFVDSISEGAITDFEWMINGESYTQINIDSLVNYPGKYEVCLTINYSFNCSQSICSDFMIGMEDNYRQDFSYKFLPGGTVQCIPQMSSQELVENVKWSYDGNFMQDGGIFETQLTSGIHKVDMEVTYKNNVVLRKSKNIRYQNQDCFFEEIRIENNPDFQIEKGVLFTYTDAQGKEYKSFFTKQPHDYFLKISDFSEYMNNNSGDQVSRMKVNFDVLLENNSLSSSKSFNNFEGYIGIAHP